MSLRYKIDVLAALKAAGYSTYKIRGTKDSPALLSESTVQKLRKRQSISWDNIEKICKLLNCQPGDLIEYVPDNETKSE